MYQKLMLGSLSLALLTPGCGSRAVNPRGNFIPGGKTDSSLVATILDFEWDGSLDVVGGASFPRGRFESQLYYTVGQLNGSRAVGRMDSAALSNVQVTDLPGGNSRVTFHAKMPVAWGSKTNLPTSYTFRLPRLIDGFASFTTKYGPTCTDPEAHDLNPGSMWYYYRPDQNGCALDASDIVESSVTVSVSAVNTTGKYPEYDKVWADGALRVVAIFGKYEKTATDNSDAGISAYHEFVRRIRDALSAHSPTTVPAQIPDGPGNATPEVSFDALLPDGREIIVNALLVDEVSSATRTFYDRYSALSTRADFIVYNGHAGLGANIRTLARQGQWIAGQYVMVFMNGCDTYTYVDTALADTRASLNPDDPTGTKYMDFILNAMPAFFNSDASNTMAVIGALLQYDAPMTYEQIFANFDSAQEALVSGEQDNTFVPGTPIALPPRSGTDGGI